MISFSRTRGGNLTEVDNSGQWNIVLQIPIALEYAGMLSLLRLTNTRGYAPRKFTLCEVAGKSLYAIR